MPEVVATGLPLHRGVPLGVDSTMGAPLHATGLPHPHAADTDGVAIARLERKKRTTYPELVESNRLRLTTLACETGGRWSDTCVKTVRLLAKAKARSAREDQQTKLAAAYANRWWNLLSVAAQNSLAASLANDKPLLADGVDGEEPDWLDVLYESLGTSTHAHGGDTGNRGSTDPLEVAVVPA